MPYGIRTVAQVAICACRNIAHPELLRFAHHCARHGAMSISYEHMANRLAPHRGNWLRKSLEVSGVSAAEMATIIDVSSRTMTNYLAGATKPRERALKEWSMRTGVPIEFLKTGVMPPAPDG